MFRNILVTYFIIASACAMQLEYLKDDSEELLDRTLNEDLLMTEEQPVLCLICKHIIEKVKHHLGKHENAEKIKKELMTLCDKSGPVKRMCKEMVTNKIDILVKELYTDDDPKTICAKADLCKSVRELELI
ncbi:hypothetical protein HF521_021528 [Silurus meridionalis]|uniref:Saposin B-type domain-containing protein n=1 Tax=Silurus meridionalis TaxID=175797 RepID=A0A8T0BG15_SILME|nr:hypothetical protein HF521_021528 [Silurus meridionalis]